jgi:hypothetical protein
MGGSYAAVPARADNGASTVVVAGATAGLTALATLLVKDYFDGRKESKRIARETEDVLEEVKRIESRAEAMERENDRLVAKITAAEAAAQFWNALISEDEEFFKPARAAERVIPYERGLELLLVRNPELADRVHRAISQPAGDWERAVLIRAYGAGTPGADFWELRKRLAQGLAGGVVLVAGEREARYVSGAENVMAVLDYVRSVAGEYDYEGTLQRLWRCTPEEVEAVLAVFPEGE